MNIRFEPNTRYYGDCLEIMADFDNNSIDLICLDPPFNSNERYHTIFKGTHGLRNIDPQIKAFDDMWIWNPNSAQRVQDIKNAVATPASKVIAGFEQFIPQSKMLSYTSYMAQRLFERNTTIMKRTIERLFLLLVVLFIGCSEGNTPEESNILNDIVWEWQVASTFPLFEGSEGSLSSTWEPESDVKWLWAFKPDGSWKFEMPLSVPIYSSQGELKGELSWKEILSGDFTLKGRDLSIFARDHRIEANTSQFISVWNMTKEEYAAEMFTLEQVSGDYTVWIKDEMLRLTKPNGQEILFKKYLYE